MKKIFQIYNSICSKYEDIDELISTLISFLSGSGEGNSAFPQKFGQLSLRNAKRSLSLTRVRR